MERMTELLLISSVITFGVGIALVVFGFGLSMAAQSFIRRANKELREGREYRRRAKADEEHWREFLAVQDEYQCFKEADHASQ